jgi:hypothetical protein
MPAFPSSCKPSSPTTENKTYGRTQVYAGQAQASADIIKNSDGSLNIIGMPK